MTYAALTKDAQKGDAKARYELALMYHRGAGVPKDLKQAARWYRMAAEQGHVKAQKQLASMYFRGDGVAVQYDKAIAWHQKAAEQGDKESQQQLAEMFCEGLGVEADFEKSLVWYELAGVTDFSTIEAKFRKRADGANAGKLQYQLARLIESGRVQGDEAESLQWFQKAADNSHLEAMLCLALRLGMTQSDPVSRMKSRQYLERARDCGSSDAEWELAIQRYEENPSPESLAKVIEGAERGHSRSQYVAARGLLHDGVGSTDYKLDRESTVLMLRSAARNGLPQAQHLLGQILMSGSFAEQGEALSWLYQAARGGHTESQLALGCCQFVGPEERLQWLETAARNEYAEAQLKLSESYFALGREEQAFSFMRRAAVNGLAEAKFRLGKLLLEDKHDSAWEEARAWLLQAADANHGEAALLLYKMHTLDSLVAEAPMSQPFEWLLVAANSGNPEGLFILATMDEQKLLRHDICVDQQEMLRRSANVGHPQARFVLAKRLIDAQWSEADSEESPATIPEEALLLMTQAAQGGVVGGAEWLAQYYMDSDDIDSAVPYLEMLSESGDAVSAYKLANILTEKSKSGELQGNDIEPRIVHYLELASRAGNAEACFQLAVMTARGEGTTEDYEESFKLFKRAADSGMTEAKFRAGVMLLSGIGTEIDADAAEKLLHEAAEEKHVEAAFALAELCAASPEEDKRERARSLYDQASASGHVAATVKLAEASLSLERMPENLEFWGDALVLQANCGERLAQVCLLKLFSQPPDAYKNIDIALFWYRRGRELKKGDAQFWLSECYLLGLGVDADVELAQKLLWQAAENGNANAQLQLADSYYFGEGVEQDFQRAAELYHCAAEQGNSKAQFNLASMCELGEGIEVNLVAACDLYRSAAVSGHGFAQLALARLLMDGGKPEGEKEAVEWLLSAAELDLAEAFFMLGELRWRGGVWLGKNIDESVNYYRHAADLGHAGAQVALARMFFADELVVDPSIVVAMLREAETSGHVEAAYHLGNLYLRGQFVDAHPQAAYDYMLKSAEAGFAKAQVDLALMYLNGVFVDEDPAISSYWMEQAALKGWPEAQYMIGLMYLEGSGKEKDEITALTWFQEAAHNGHAEACYMLARAYHMGIGLDPDQALAVNWCRRAADQGHEDAIKLLKQLTDKKEHSNACALL